MPDNNDPPPPGVDPALDKEIARLTRLATVANYGEEWSKATVAEVRAQLQREYGQIPTLGELCAKFGEARVLEEAKALKRERRAELDEAAERLGIGSGCHLCQAQRSSSAPYYEFGLAGSASTETHWGGFAAGLALNLLTLPFGAMVVSAPGSTTKMRLARCRLALCERCAAKRRGLLGGLRVRKAECELHPSWQRLNREGFTRWLNSSELASVTAVP